MPVNLPQIAEVTGLSIETVARVLLGDTQFGEDATPKIYKAAEQMGYHPDLLAHHLQAGRTKRIGVMVPSRAEFPGRVLFGIHETLANNGHVPMLLWAQPGLPEIEQIHRLIDHRVDGMILYASEDAAPDEYLAEIWGCGLPAVTVDRRMPLTHADFVGTDNKLGGRLAAEHLLGLGHRRLWYLTAKPTVSTSTDRWEGFREKIEQCPGATVTKTVAKAFHEGFGPARRNLAAPDRPTAVFTANDYLAVSVINAAQELGLRVPNDVSVVGFADVSIASIITPTLTTFRQNAEVIGNTAAQIILDRLDGKLTDKNPKVVNFKPELVLGASTTKSPDA